MCVCVCMGGGGGGGGGGEINPKVCYLLELVKVLHNSFSLYSLFSSSLEMPPGF